MDAGQIVIPGALIGAALVVARAGYAAYERRQAERATSQQEQLRQRQAPQPVPSAASGSVTCGSCQRPFTVAAGTQSAKCPHCDAANVVAQPD